MEKHVLSVLAVNNSGVIGRVAGLFSRRGYSIQSISAAQTENPDISRMTIVVEGNEDTLEQIDKQLSKLVDVREVILLSENNSVRREHVLVKAGNGEETRNGLIEVANLFKAKVVDVGMDNLMLELTGEPRTISAFIRLIEPYGIKNLVRTGISALERG
ncbi:MAG: acetolactate synthase, small subunit [Oscillospiraceae bacterium]|jgi:acetolactate synthase-1/3 small subunit|nr:acetolactate synthase, small subunit [Oscillospiraceae bacterium]